MIKTKWYQKPIYLMVVLALVLALGIVAVPMAETVEAATLYECYNTGDELFTWLYGQEWRAQTFTAESDHTVTSVKLKIGREGYPGEVMVSITATNSTGHPTGPDLTSGTTDGNTLPVPLPWEWREITLTPYSLTSGAKYAIVVRALNGTSGNELHWRGDGSSPTYAGGEYGVSNSSGTSWDFWPQVDLMFEVWSEPPTEVWVDDSWICQADVDLFDPSLTWQYDAFNVTQDGINAVAEDGTVHVRPGKYTEKLVINQSLTLQSTDGWVETSIDPVPDSIIRIEGDVDVTVQGFEITGGSYGIHIGEVFSTVNVLDCFIHDNAAEGIAAVGGGDLLHIEGNIISQNGGAVGGCGIYIDQAWNTTNILDNIIGGWTYYPEDSGDTTAQRYLGNSAEGIYIDQVGNTSIVNIEGNKISENAWAETNTGIYISDVYGEVTIAGNDIGAREDEHGGTYLGNWGEGIYVGWVYPGAVLTIGPNNSIKENTDDGIEIFNAHPAGVATITIDNNTIDNNDSDGIELGTPCEVDGATISHNTITHHQKGIFLTGPSDHNTIINNTIELNGIGIYLQWVDSEESTNNNTISDNEISNNGHGIWVEGYYNEILRNNILNNKAAPASGIHLTTTALGNIIHCNNIEGNVPWGVYNENADETLDATNNWWGDASGPSGAGPGSGDAVSDHVDYSSWLPTPFQYCPECGGTPLVPVGGEAYPINKLAILAPWMALAASMVVGIAILARRRRASS